MTKIESKRSRLPAADYHEFFGGLIRLHVLHHACEGPIYGMEMIEELRRHDYRISAGTLYPLLHRLEDKGYLIATEQRNGGSTRRVYRATRAGRAALKAGKARVRELFGELFEDPVSPSRRRQSPSKIARVSAHVGPHRDR